MSPENNFLEEPFKKDVTLNKSLDAYADDDGTIDFKTANNLFNYLDKKEQKFIEDHGMENLEHPELNKMEFFNSIKSVIDDQPAIDLENINYESFYNGTFNNSKQGSTYLPNLKHWYKKEMEGIIKKSIQFILNEKNRKEEKKQNIFIHNKEKTVWNDPKEIKKREFEIARDKKRSPGVDFDE
jgi:hypothetical protein